ncbi:MAG: hypothetical protein JKY51_10915, partial [Opitutaceae bacterium]|nr:hypothetical protein [Opitutaceae bacterium]
MDWIFDNVEKFFPLLIFIAYAFSAWRKRSRKEDEDPAEGPETAERVRRIQEEIRRKIVARQQGKSSPVETPPHPLQREKPAPASVLIPPVVPIDAQRTLFVDEEGERDRQRALEENLRVA